jgi:FkbM family methyltransferase
MSPAARSAGLRSIVLHALDATANIRSLRLIVLRWTPVLAHAGLISGDSARGLVRVFADEAVNVRADVCFGPQRVALSLPSSVSTGRELMFADAFRHEREGTTLRVFAALCRGASTIVDVGANIGTFSYLAAVSADPGATVVAFEPQPDLVRVIRTNLARFGRVTVFVEALALSDEPGTMTLYMPREGALEASLDPTWASGRQVSVEAIRFDAYAALRGLQGPSVIKIDAEQWEEHILVGMASFADTYTPDVLIELLGKTRVSPFIRGFIEQHRYRMYYVENVVRAVSVGDLPYVEGFYNFLLTTKSAIELAAILPVRVIA